MHTLAGSGAGTQPAAGAGTKAPHAPGTKVTMDSGAFLHRARQLPMNAGAGESTGIRGRTKWPRRPSQNRGQSSGFPILSLPLHSSPVPTLPVPLPVSTGCVKHLAWVKLISRSKGLTLISQKGWIGSEGSASQPQLLQQQDCQHTGALLGRGGREQKETVTSPRRLSTGYLYTASDETWVKRGNGSRREDLGLRRHFPVHTGLRASRL